MTAATDTRRDADRTVLPAPPRPSLATRVPTSLAVAVVAGILAMVSVLFVTGRSDAVPVAVAARDITAGERLDAAALRFVDVAASSEVLAGLLRRGDVAGVTGWVASRTIPAGSLLARSALSPAAGPGQLRAMSFAVETEHAVGGSVRLGDRIDVIDGSGPVYVVTNAEVLGASRPDESRLSVGRKHVITIAVDAQAALRLAAAIEKGKVEVVRATGATPPPPPAQPPPRS